MQQKYDSKLTFVRAECLCYMIDSFHAYFRQISYASPGSFYHILPINLVGRFRTRYGVLGSFMRFYDPEKRLQTKRPQAKRPTAKSSLYKIKALNLIFVQRLRSKRWTSIGSGPTNRK